MPPEPDPSEDVPFETAGDLYREISARGLHVRADDGRDNGLYDELKGTMGCRVSGLQSFLDESSLTAEDLMVEFLRVAAPFAAMFQEIWRFLSGHAAPRATETVRVRFGFDREVDLDLDQFREYVEGARRVLSAVQADVWTRDALDALDAQGNVAGALAGGEDPWTFFGRASQPYDLGRPYTVPPVVGAAHAFDADAVRIQAALQALVDRVEDVSREGLGHLIDPPNPEGVALREAAFWLTDFLPLWSTILAGLGGVEASRKSVAHRAFAAEVEPRLEQRRVVREVPVRELLDILNLPFWRHRWHTYEVWSTVLTLRSLDAFAPVLNVEGGYVPIDGTSAAVIATLTARGHPGACLATQIQTPYERGTRRAVRPDLRVCFADPSAGGETAGVVELKQRLAPGRAHLEEVALSYSEACPRSGGVVIANYDGPGERPTLPDDVVYIERVRPGEAAALAAFDGALLAVVERAGLRPGAEPVTVLFDTSLSMGGSYDSGDVARAVQALRAASHITVYCFRHGLVGCVGFEDGYGWRPQTGGVTDLDQSLRELEAGDGLPDRLLIVSDEEYAPTDLLDRIPEVEVCMPGELHEHLEWLGV